MNKEGKTQEPVGGMLAIAKEICSDFMFENSNRITGYKAVRKLFDDWFSNNPYWQKKLSTPPPAPIKTEGEASQVTYAAVSPVYKNLVEGWYEDAKGTPFQIIKLSAPPSPVGIDVEALIKQVGYIKRNAEKINEHTWNVYTEQILMHIEEIEAGYSASQNKPDNGTLVYTGVMDNNGVKEYIIEYDPPESSTEEEKELWWESFKRNRNIRFRIT